MSRSAQVTASVVDGVHLATGKPLRVASVHLDSDFESNRLSEMRTLLNVMTPRPEMVGVICGDINQDTVTGSLGRMLKENKYIDVLAAVGNSESTHPWFTTYYNSQKWAIIDHVIARAHAPWPAM